MIGYLLAGAGVLAAAVFFGRLFLRSGSPRYDSRTAYQLYLDSAEWRRVRQERLAIDNYRCRGAHCGEVEGLEVHHITYDRFGHEDVFTDLVTVCSRCHHAIHRMQRSQRCSLEWATAVVLAA